MVIYYGRDPQGRRVEVQVSQQQHKDIQAAGGWRQSGAESQVKGQIQQQYQEAVAKEQVRIESIKAEAIRAGKTVLEKKSGEVIITDPEKARVQQITAAAVSVTTPRITAPDIEPRPSPTPPYTRKDPFAESRQIIKEPPKMPAVRVTEPTPFTLFEARPKAVIGLERMYEKPPPELFEFLVPKRTEREIAYPSPRVGIRPIVEFPLGVAYGVVTLPTAIVRMPETAYAFVTDPIKSITAMGERFARMPGFFVGEIAGQTAATYGLGKLFGLGVAKVKARGITTELIAGEYTYRDIAGGRIGLARAKAVILKKKKPVAKLDIETIFKPAEIGEVSPAISRIMVTKPKPMRLMAAAKGITYPEVSGFYPGISKAIIFKKGKPISAAAAAGITKVEPGILKAVGIGISAPPKAKTVFGAIFREAKAPPPITMIKAAPKVITKPGIPAVVTTTEAIVKGVSKAITKPPKAIPRTGVLTGAVTAFIGKAEAMKYMPAEEEVYISPRAREVVGVQALDTRQRVLSMQRFGLGAQQIQASAQKLGLGTRQAQATLSQLGIGRITMPRERISVVSAVGIMPGIRVAERFDIKFEPGLILEPPVVKPRERVDVIQPPPPVILPGTPFVLFSPERKKVVKKKKPKAKPAYKYREVRHPFPSLKSLMGI